MQAMFESLDFIYSPSADVAAELAHFELVLGARVLFAIEEMGTRVAMLEPAPGSPRLLLAGHLEGERPVLVYRVGDLEAATDELHGRGLSGGRMIELPMGRAYSFSTPAGVRLALYEATRPGVVRHFEGRRDF